jgi:hypothetical protein
VRQQDRNRLEQIAGAFCIAPASPSHMHVDVYNALAALGGDAAICYGRFTAIPWRQTWKKRDAGLAVADAINRALEPA